VNSLGRALTRAGITDRRSRRGYRAISRTLPRADASHYLAVRLLVPATLQPHLLAAYWFAHAADTAADSGPLAGRRERFDDWSAAAWRAIEERTPAGARMSAFVRTMDVCGLPAEFIGRLLAGMRGDTERVGLDDEAAFESYVDQVSLPFLMLLVGVHPGCRAPEHENDFRRLAAACQRIDFLADLAADTRASRARLPGPPMALARGAWGGLRRIHRPQSWKTA
jgi:15-cis-phytoene synthase